MKTKTYTDAIALLDEERRKLDAQCKIKYEFNLTERSLALSRAIDLLLGKLEPVQRRKVSKSLVRAVPL